jgi:hypothetical protein
MGQYAPGGTAEVNAAADKYSDVRRSSTKTTLAIALLANVEYASKAYPGIVPTAIGRGTRALEGKLQNEAERFVARMERNAT